MGAAALLPGAGALSSGRALAKPFFADDSLPGGRFEWFDFEFDGRASGRTAELRISGYLRDGFWRINGLVMFPV